MSIQTHRHRAVARTLRFGDRVFIGACTAAWLMLAAAVIAALKIYGG